MHNQPAFKYVIQMSFSYENMGVSVPCHRFGSHGYCFFESE